MRKPVTASFVLEDEAATGALAAGMADALPADTAGWIVLLQGELGAGKSTFARALLRRLGHRGPVPSPTYTLVEPYEIGGRVIYHIDLYRINDPDELQYLGWSDWADGMILVEWPERAGTQLEHADVRVHLEYAGAGRSATLSGLSQRGSELVRRATPVSEHS
ncbi:MAG TPA: tRNA (adenosine(37)-N6)-threonylcarbamoyltransferase complex ATPase subunit type 1 TsaE [Woeseiaceae bacterium]|nr:tRNA (adenosine(37)-N6)-threonylcarbamoyltransferase complex ATPase subunit type 1 TsaE [Woeseiaceae bacterium]